MRFRVVIVVTLYALAVAFTAAAYRLYLPQYTLMRDRGWGTVQRGASVTVKELYPENPDAERRLRAGDEVVALDADAVMLLNPTQIKG
ncbi:MAG TPA: hypothetical protein VM936_08130 [Pyrinomonadaceae bacterium]|jgi:hypothetical protein|nr:hypothetical protein [Pyrinomonadaceae bacterium]